jgi:hypothetical protein
MITLTKYTAHRPTRLSKKFSLIDGKPMKENGGKLIDGIAERIEVADLSEFATVQQSLDHKQALSYGVNGHDRARVVPRAAVATTEDALPVIARDHEHIHWPDGEGIFLGDYDPPDGASPLTQPELLGLFYAHWPALRDGPHLWRPSASSCIVNSETGDVLRGVAGQRVYAIVKDSTDLPRAGQVLVDRMWLAGHGWIMISKSGSPLLRSPVDATAFQPERLDFAGGSECDPPLVQRLPEPLVLNPDAAPIDTWVTLPDLTEAERQKVTRLQTEAKAAKAEEAAAVRASWMDGRMGDLTKRHPDIPEERLRAVLRQAVEGQVLTAEFILYDARRQAVTVAELLANPAKWHGKYVRDPLEPGYSTSAAWVCIDGKGAFLYSHAHGLGVRYTLMDVGQMFGDESGAAEPSAKAGGGEPDAPLEPFHGPMADAVAAGLATSTKPQPELTMLAALIGMAACCEGHYHLPSGGRLNLYGVGVADTGWGKDRPRELGIEIARAGGADLIGKPASGQGLEDALKPYQGILCEVDEVAHLVEALNGSKKPAYLIELSSMLLRLFSASGGTFNPRVKATSGDETPRPPIPHPCVNLLGFATPEKLGEAVDVVNIAEGLIGRFLVAFGRPGVTPRRYRKLALPESVTDRGQAIQRAIVVGRFDEDGIEIQINPDADARLDELLGEFDTKMTTASSPFAKALLVRSFEKCERVAGVLAVWDNPVEPRITLEHVTWAEHFVNASDSAVLRFCGEYLHGGQVQADAALVLKMIKRVFNKEISPARKGELAYVKRGFAPHSTVLRASKLDKRRFDDAIAYLVDLDDIHKVPDEGVQANGRRYPVMRYTLPGG